MKQPASSGIGRAIPRAILMGNIFFQPADLGPAGERAVMNASTSGCSRAESSRLYVSSAQPKQAEAG